MLVRGQKKLIARFWQSASQFWREERPRAAGLAVFLVALVLLQLLVQFLLNRWNRDFFDALQRKDGNALWAQAQLFFLFAAASILLAATSVWGRMKVQRNWRESLTRHVIDIWADKDRFLHCGHLIKGAENPEYRIAVDIRIATEAPVDLTLALFSSVLTAITFLSVLWATGGGIDVVVFGFMLFIPGYLVFGVIIYSGIVSALMVLVGHHLTGVNRTHEPSRSGISRCDRRFSRRGQAQANRAIR